MNNENTLAFLKEVRKLAKEYGIKNLFVVADGFSIKSVIGKSVEREIIDLLSEQFNSWLDDLDLGIDLDIDL